MNIKRVLRHWWQRRTRGFDDSETYSLDMTLAQHILPRLKRFKELNFGMPGEFQTLEEWELILDSMIEAFELSANQFERDMFFLTDEEKLNLQIGLNNFAKYYRNLWW